MQRLYETGLIDRVRGGSWINNQRNCRAACRNRNTPLNFNNNSGFRAALSHVFARVVSSASHEVEAAETKTAQSVSGLHL